VRKVKADFDAAGVARSEDEIRVQMIELLAVAISQIEAG
jgi:hypothetical protein